LGLWLSLCLEFHFCDVNVFDAPYGIRNFSFWREHARLKEKNKLKMKIHEYQAKHLLKSCNVKICEGFPAFTPEEAREVAARLPGNKWVVKAQIHAGGRGKAGGVKMATSLEDVQAHAQDILGKTLMTPQTGPEGKVVKRLYIESASTPKHEYYFAMLVDRATQKIKAIVSQDGGVDIEDVAAKNPSAIHEVEIDPAVGFQAFHGRKLAQYLGYRGKKMLHVSRFFPGIYQAFRQYDASMIEINPLIENEDGDILALDAKMTFDENALFRHSQDILPLRDKDEEDPTEQEAAQHDLNYVKLNGSIGCLVNGAGLAMATMDLIKLYGEEPANFLDVGGGATKERVAEAFKLILKDTHVKAILVNIFGGIMRCDVIAEGIVAAAKEIKMHVPLVVRLAGTNRDQGRDILQHADVTVQVANDLEHAAKLVTQAAREDV